PVLLIGFDSGEVKHYLHANHMFSIAAATDGTGNVVERYVYTPYGQRTILNPAGTTPRAASDIGNDRGHQGLRHDAETGLVYNRARYLDPVLGRLIGRDPLWYVDGMGLYEYVGGRPLKYQDNSGKQAEQDQCCTSPYDDLETDDEI